MNAPLASLAILVGAICYRQLGLLYTLLLSILAGLIFSYMGTKNDPYGLFHLELNKRPEGKTNSPPATEWLNMGYWRETTDFPQACQALAMRLVQASECKPGGRILDVGHGTGESLILHLCSSSVPRPQTLVGITSLQLHYQRSLERIHRLQASNPSADAVSVVLYHGDAVYQTSALNHPLDPSSNSKFDSIFALDCAYHFNTRETFLAQSYRCLARGGRIALADICFTEESIRRSKTRAILRLLRIMPMENAVSISEYVRTMEKIGFVDIKTEDISEYVFPGFLSFLRSRGIKWWIFANVMGCLPALGGRFVVVSGKRT